MIKQISIEKVHLALGATDLRKSVDGLALQALQLRKVPSCSIMRQRFDAVGEQWNSTIKEENDAIENIKILYQKDTEADFIIKRNLRKESIESWLNIEK